MTTLPARQEQYPLDLESRAIFSWRSHRGVLAPLTVGPSAVFTRSGTKTGLTDARAESYTAQAHRPGWTYTAGIPGVMLNSADSEALYWTNAALWAPQSCCGLVDFIERGTAAGTALDGLWYLGNAGATAGRLWIDTDGTTYRINHHNGTSAVSSLLGTAPSAGERCRLRWTLSATGVVRIHQTIDDDPESSATASGTLALASAWGSSSRIYLGSVGSANVGDGAEFRRLIVAVADRTFDELEAML